MKRSIWGFWWRWAAWCGLLARLRLRLSLSRWDRKSVYLSTQSDKQRSARDLKRDLIVLSIGCWLSEDESRTLPMPDDGASIHELAQAIGINEAHAKSVLKWAYGETLSPRHPR